MMGGNGEDAVGSFASVVVEIDILKSGIVRFQ